MSVQMKIELTTQQKRDQASFKAFVEQEVVPEANAYAASKAARDAVQIHGANGCSQEYDVQRYLRDTVVMEIIEGSTQIQQITLAKYAYHAYAPNARVFLVITGGKPWCLNKAMRLQMNMRSKNR